MSTNSSLSDKLTTGALSQGAKSSSVCSNQCYTVTHLLNLFTAQAGIAMVTDENPARVSRDMVQIHKWVI